jgi:hypothetical protein
VPEASGSNAFPTTVPGRLNADTANFDALRSHRRSRLVTRHQQITDLDRRPRGVHLHPDAPRRRDLYLRAIIFPENEPRAGRNHSSHCLIVGCRGRNDVIWTLQIQDDDGCIRDGIGRRYPLSNVLYLAAILPSTFSDVVTCMLPATSSLYVLTAFVPMLTLPLVPAITSAPGTPLELKYEFPRSGAVPPNCQLFEASTQNSARSVPVLSRIQ